MRRERCVGATRSGVEETGCQSGMRNTGVWTCLMSRTDPWQARFTNICQEIRNISHPSKTKRSVLYNKVPKIYYRDKTVSLDTHEESETDDAYSVYNTPQDTGSGHSSDIPEHYDTPIYNASLVPPSESPMPGAPHTPLLIPRSRILEPSSDVGLGRACNADLSQSPSSCMNAPGESDRHTEEGVATKGESSWLE